MFLKSVAESFDPPDEAMWIIKAKNGLPESAVTEI